MSTPSDPWFPWFEAFSAACSRFVSETERPNETAQYHARYLELVERLLAVQPPRPAALDRIIVEPQVWKGGS